MSRPRVLLIGNFLSGSRGTRSVCEDLAVALAAVNWGVLTTSSKQNRVARLVDILLTTVWRRKHYEVAHVDVHSGLGVVWADLICFLLRIINKPYVLTLHGGDLPGLSPRLVNGFRRILQKASFVTAPSSYLVEKMRSYRQDIVLLPNALELERYPFKCRKEPDPNILWLRTFHDTYNPSLAVRSVAHLVKRFPSVNLTMIGPDRGDGSLESTIRLARELGISERVFCVGPVPKRGIPDWLHKGDIFLNTSRVDNAPVTVLEAMACGLCIVSTNVGGMTYMLEDGFEGLLVAADDHKAMANGILRLLTEEGLAERLSLNARRKAEQFGWSSVLPRWNGLLTSCCGPETPR